MDNCTNKPHRFYCAEVVACEAVGKVFTIMVCTECCEFKYGVLDIGAQGVPIRLLKEEKQNKEGKL